ncbi:MAG: DNA polymerase/3'-5' exonuclease PolX, partial [Verrucomicrobiales bacterium]
MITREQITETLESIALLLELKGENPFKVRAYRTGAEIVENSPEDILALATGEDASGLEALKGIGSALALKLHELATTGKLDYYEKLRAEFPDDIFELFAIQGLGPKKIKALYEQLGVNSAASLKRALESGAVSKLPGFGAKSSEKILAAIAFRESNAEFFRAGEVAAPAQEILAYLRQLPEVSRAESAGSQRRAKEIVHDLDFLVASNKPARVMEHFLSMPAVLDVINRGETKSSIHLENGLQCDLRVVSNAEYPCALCYFTGSVEHNVAMRSRALKRGFTLNEYSLSPLEGSDAEAPAIEQEADLYRALDLDFVEPELRENLGEIEAAEAGELPVLVELSNLRGTFHCHTTASDGKNSLREMAEAALELGLQYLGIADHSVSSFQANGLDEARLRTQMGEIDDLNKEFKSEFRLFSGTECDILKDGSLDFEDELLDELDYVVASVHSSFTLSESAMTARIIKAIENPRVTMLGHLTGRLLLSRDPYALNIPAV